MATRAGAGPAQARADYRAMERLRAALNFGWSVAELRGRLRYGHQLPPGDPGYKLRREMHALPLGDEHSLRELQISAQKAVTLLAERFHVDEDLVGDGQDPSAWMQRLATALEKALTQAEQQEPTIREVDRYPAGSAVTDRWNEVADAIYRWDEEIQDHFSISAELLAAYQLGRGLAESFWALDPAVPAHGEDDPARASSWEFLLGHHRNALLSGYVTLLEGVLPAQSAPAIKGPLDRWTALVNSGHVREHGDAPAALRAQLQVWRDVLLGSRNPASYAKRFGIRVGIRQFGRVLRAFGFELFIGGLGIAALAVAGYSFGAGKPHGGWAAVASVLGFFGVTGAGLLARAKTQAQALFDHLQLAFYRDVVAEKATVLPKGVKH